MRNSKLILILVFFLKCHLFFGQNILEKGTNIVNYQKLKYTRTNQEFGKISLIENPNSEFGTLQIETKKRPKFIYKASTSIPLKKQKLKKGQVVLFSFKGITIKSGLETGEARFLCVLRQTNNYKGNIEATVSLATEWKTYYIPFELTQDVSADDLGMALQFGFQPQIALFDDVKFLVFKKGTALTDLPKTKIKYVGMEADAPWRSLAEERIANHRKTDFEVSFVKNGKPLQNKMVQVKLVDHEFSWGVTLNASDVMQDENQLKYASKGFNEVVFANDLKIKSWKRPKNKERTLAAIQKIKEKKLRLKGHVLIWPGFQYQNQEIRNLEGKPELLSKKIKNHVLDISNQTIGNITHWDVVNEAYTNTDFQRITGSEEILYEGFRTMKKQQPNVGRFTNEYGIISKGGIDTQKQQWYYDYIKRIDSNTNNAVDGIGIQCHIGSDLTPPARVVEILDYYGRLNKKISISEFTMEIRDAEIREKYTTDFITAIFSHPNVNEFLFWGFHETGNPKAIIYKKDWSLAPMGKAFYGLVHSKWKTNFNQKTSKKGIIKGNGFYGTYEYSFLDGKILKTGKFKILKGGVTNMKIAIK